MNNENTIYNDEKTVYKDNTNSIDKTNVAKDKNTNEKEKKSKWGKAAAGLGLGILMGGTMSFVSAAPIDNDPDEDSSNENPDTDTNNTSLLSDGNIPVATSVSDDMSFSEAFAAARAEIGHGGVFEWNGNVYNTYYAEEWNNMSQEEKNDFASHLNIIEVHETNTSDNDEIVPDIEEDVFEEEIEIHDTIPENTPSDEEIVPSDEIEILGLYQDNESGFVYGEVMIDNQEIILVDVDDDSTFDFAAIDSDYNGHISEEEIADISEYGMSYETYDDGDLLAL